MTVNKQQLRFLKGKAHDLKPVIMIGQNGLSENLINELQQSLTHHELLKIKLPALEKNDRAELIEKLCELTGAEIIQQIGHVLVIFKQAVKKSKFSELSQLN